MKNTKIFSSFRRTPESRFWTPAFAGVTAFLLSVSSVHAEATKEFFTESGLYSGSNGSLPMNIFQWAFSAINVNANATTDPAPPEGNKVAAAVVSAQYGGWGIFNVATPGSLVAIDRNYSDYAGGHIRFWLKSSANLTMRVEYVSLDGTTRQIPIQPLNTGGVWREITLPLSSFPSDFNLQRIRSPFMIAQEGTPGGSTSWSVDHVRWTKPVASLQIFPASTQVNTGKKRQFTIEGRDAANEPIYLYGTYLTGASVGTMNPGDPAQVSVSTLTANTSDGPVTASALVNVGATPGSETYMSAIASVDNTTANLEQRFGVLSETHPGVQLGSSNPDQNSDMLLFSENTGNPATLPIVSDDSSDAVEGTKSVKTILLSKGLTTQFQGWAIKWGRDNASENLDTFVRDMNPYYNGSIRFWFKGPANPDLINKLEVGIRSGNVAAGKEISKVKLSNYVAFDGQWHSVSIPISVFAKSRPWADIARTKVFFSVAIAGVVGGTEANRTIRIDDLRWDTQVPGVLSRIDVAPNQGGTPIFVPFGFKRLFTAKGYDASGAAVDISPTWDFAGPALGTITPTTGPSTILTAANSAVQGNIRATFGGVTGVSLVNVDTDTFSGAINIYTDLGVGGNIGISTGPSTAAGTSLGLNELLTGGAEGTKFFRSTYTLASTAGQRDAFANWFVEEPGLPRYMGGYENGYLHFFVRTSQDLEISIRSNNVNPDTNRAKIFLSEFGVPLDNNWQEVVIPLDYFKEKESGLDFTQIKTFFAIGTTASLIGNAVDQTFDVDDVRWLSTDSRVPDVNKVYQGLKEKQRPSGLVRSYDTLPSAYTYDQELAAMAYTFHKDTGLAKNVLDVYKNKFLAGGFDGFYDDYDVDALSPREGNRTTGPNAWILLAMVHYKNVTGSTDYDATMAGLAAWLRSLQAGDGSILYGRNVNPVIQSVKSTEHNLDCYAAFSAYAQAFPGSAIYQTVAQQVGVWLQTSPLSWNAAQGRFNVGSASDGVTPNTDKALDVYSWPPLVFPGDYASVVSLAEAEFGNTKVNNLTGLPVTGFDFSGSFGAPVDKDAVWLEGTSQMVLAYLAVGNTAKATQYLNEVRKAIVNISQTSQGIPYATNDGTAYGFQMTSNYPSISSDAWYIFAERNFNPFRVFPIFRLTAKNISNNQPASGGAVSWNNIAPGAGWVASGQYVQLDAQPVSTDPWGIQIYTDNLRVQGSNPIFVDLTPGLPNNPDSDPAGLLLVTGAPTSVRLPMAWSIKDLTGTVPVAADPNNAGDPNSSQWLYMFDMNTPAIDWNGNGNTTDPGDGDAFQNGNPFISPRNASGIHTGQRDTDFFRVLAPDYLYFQGDFSSAAAQSTYQTTLYLEFYLE